MDRRSFLKLSSGLVLLSACKDSFIPSETSKINFPIHLKTNSNIGHLVRRAVKLPITEELNTETLIVGGGIAGMSAAYTLRNTDFLLCELDADLGGTSGAVNINGNFYSQGAHYDLSYPNNYGEEALSLLAELDVIYYNKEKNRWDFTDKEYLVSSENEESCYQGGELRASVLPSGELKQNFKNLLKEYEHQFPLPTRLISLNLHYLDDVTFYDYLAKYLPVTSNFMEAIDYQMLDDFGGTSKEISALAGIHYYKCRSYYDGKKINLFSPPEGNYYFIQKIVKKLKQEKLRCNNLVFAVKKIKDKWHTDVLDVKKNIRRKIISNKLIYAGQKHALKHIYPKGYEVFKDINYAPWVVINIVLEDVDLKNSKWQNDFLSEDPNFLGFVDSKIQDKTIDRVLTAYYCFKDIHHFVVKNLEENADILVQETIQNISLYYKIDIQPLVKEVFIKLLGHAMPIPEPNYLTKQRDYKDSSISFAGVDTGRLPLMFEAMDSGIQAVKRQQEDG